MYHDLQIGYEVSKTIYNKVLSINETVQNRIWFLVHCELTNCGNTQESAMSYYGLYSSKQTTKCSEPPK